MPRILVMNIAGSEVRAKGLRLFPGPDVAVWRAMLVQAQQELAGTASGIGLFGSPGWVLGGAMVLGAVETMMSSSKAKDGVRTLGRANNALKDIRENGLIFDFSELRNLAEPNPSAWVGDAEGFKTIDMSKIPLLDRSSLLKAHDRTKADVRDGHLSVPADVLYVGLDEGFICVQLENGGLLNIRWSSVDTFVFEG